MSQSHNNSEADVCLSKLTSEEVAQLNRIVKQTHFKKGQLIVSSGQHIKSCYTVMQGIVREWQHTTDGEHTTEWYIAGDTLSEAQGNDEKRATLLNWECATDCIISHLLLKDEEELYKKFPRLEMLSRVDSEQKFSAYRKRIQNYLIASPEERYLNLINTRPEIISTAPQYQIASYIGVKPESLSRIRARMASTA